MSDLVACLCAGAIDAGSLSLSLFLLLLSLSLFLLLSLSLLLHHYKKAFQFASSRRSGSSSIVYE
jgi:hypothetical protein